MMRYWRIIKRILKSIQMWFSIQKEFNINMAFWMCYVFVFPSRRKKRYIAALTNFFEKDMVKLIEKYSINQIDCEDALTENHNIVWTCWLTGYESMPEIVKLCFKRMKNMIPQDQAEVVLITLDNFRNYIDVPGYIWEKYKSGVISPAHFSDVIRFCLLSKYGGMWLDATVYISGKIPIEYLEAQYYTQKVSDIDRYPNEPSRAQWCGFIWAGKKGNLLFSFVRDGLFYYWKKYNRAIDYIFFDYIILAAYKNIPIIQQMMDQQEPNNEEIWGLWSVINEKYDVNLFREICEKNIFHKLTYKSQLKEETEDGTMTMYAYLLSKGEE